ncbi:hyaluronidase-like [Pollicipes pollicipes]|uniref:hyaluronidase-like n=1 Tax=Pollicipes pollicipes TaxID=41117 RepID=UPI0018858604|nr:hyaluronidase-like [Pollicipes pollicipes]
MESQLASSLESESQASANHLTLQQLAAGQLSSADLTENQLTESHLTESQLTESQLTENQLTESQLMGSLESETQASAGQLTGDGRPGDGPAPAAEPFRVFWNVPSAPCTQSFGVDLNPGQYGFTVNAGEKFAGEQIVLLYSPGLFPNILKNGTEVNGGLPQVGSLDVHLKRFQEDLERSVPDVNFSGVGVIDFEGWTPWFAALASPLKQAALQLVRRQHPQWTDTRVAEQAREDFEWWARLFLQRTLEAAERARPAAAWGYYQYPLCGNLHIPNGTCPQSWRDKNDRLSWLLSSSSALYPSVYLFRNGFTDADRRATVRGRLDEALRLAAEVPVYTYTWFRYQDDPSFLSEDDLLSMLGQVRTRGLPGAVMWGSYLNCDSAAQCHRLDAYLRERLGPLVRRLVALTPAEVHTWRRLLATQRGRRLLRQALKWEGPESGDGLGVEW